MANLDLNRIEPARTELAETEPAETEPARTGSSAPSQARDRLAPPRPLDGVTIERSLAWLRWFGVARLSVVALSVTAIAVGMWWLLRAPAVPVEQKLPFATANGPAPTVTPIAGSVATSPATAAAGEATDSSVQSPIVVVHVAGNVNRPGIYTLGAGSRVADAVDAAGGVGVAGDLDALNLAAPIIDGERIYVPAEGEVDPASVDGSPEGALAMLGHTGVRLLRRRRPVRSISIPRTPPSSSPFRVSVQPPRQQSSMIASATGRTVRWRTSSGSGASARPNSQV